VESLTNRPDEIEEIILALDKTNELEYSDSNKEKSMKL
jgi:hypothetical protein